MGHYFSEKQDSKLNLKIIHAKLRNTIFEFFTGGGIFSPSKLDLGSKLLINECRFEANANILDLGCGYGPVGLTLAKLFPKTTVTLVDINERAVKLTKKNAKNMKLDNVTIKKSYIYENLENEKFDTILLNPPHSAGKKICLEMIKKAKDHLNKNGTLQIVARHQKGGKSLGEFMFEVFDNMEVIARKSGYRIYLSKKIKSV